MVEKEYLVPLPEGNCLRVRIRRQKSKVLDFTVQLEGFVDAREWKGIVRCDTEHGLVHLDVLRPDGTEFKIPLAFADYNQALSWTISHFKERWRFYRDRYERWRNV